ncbi:hypothetical protein L9F63_010401 [Diploptera punctata]|uniref:Gustatory receptor n=1 Tax=Diploptera punctata TaxID=6984 RepID=A0AAD8AH95_DIPPU|nr:hypothetical protein L9F63_010401 [Diploptera punctata]
MKRSVDSYSAFVPLLYILKVCGLDYLVLKGEIGKRKLQRSITSVMYCSSIILFLTTVRSIGFVFRLKFNGMYAAVYRILNIADTFHYFVTLLFLLVSISTSHLLIEIFNYFSEFDWRFNGLHKLCSRCALIAGIRLLIGILYYIFCVATFIIPPKDDNYFEYYIIVYTLIMDLGIMLIVNIKITTVTLLLSQRFEYINNLIVDLVKQFPGTLKHGSTLSMSDRIKHLTNHRDLVNSVSNKIVFIAKMHNLLCDVCDIYNSIFSLQALFVVLLCFVEFTLDIYIIITIVFDQIEHNADTFNAFLSLFLESFWYIVHVGVLIISGECTANEANRTAVLVHKLLNKKRDSGSIPALRSNLQLFSLQLLHRKVQFTACGFFPLDFTLLYSIVGAISAYLVILIQFQLTFSEKENNVTTVGSIYNFINTTNNFISSGKCTSSETEIGDN